MNKSGLIGAVVTGAAIIILIILAFICTCKVPAGYVGVVYNMNGGIQEETLSQGWHIIRPTQKVTMYTIGLEQSYLTSESKGDSDSDESFNIPTSDGKTVKVDLEFSYRFDPDRVAQTFVTFKGKSGETIKDTFIKPKIVAWTQEVSANYPVADIFGDKRTAINAELDTYLREKFNQYGIIIDTVNFTNISVDPETAEAIQKKVNAQQALELAQVEAQTAKVNAEKDKEVASINATKDREVAKIEAEKKKEVASINAEAAIIDANAKADVVRIEAEAEANANKEIAQSLTPELIEFTKMNQWNGELPKVSTNGSSILNIDSEIVK